MLAMKVGQCSLVVKCMTIWIQNSIAPFTTSNDASSVKEQVRLSVVSIV